MNLAFFSLSCPSNHGYYTFSQTNAVICVFFFQSKHVIPDYDLHLYHRYAHTYISDCG